MRFKSRLYSVQWNVLFLMLFFIVTPKAYTADITSYAFVKEDGTLKLRGRKIRLYGIHIPTTKRTCRTFTRPVKCSTQAALALEFKIGASFVSCEPQWRNDDRSTTAVCRVKGEDLGAYLIERGWALALPDAPFEYVALEKISRSRGIGVWGFPGQRVITKNLRPEVAGQDRPTTAYLLPSSVGNMARIKCYSVRRLSPFQGLLQIIESNKSRAVSADGINWQVQVHHEMQKPRWGSLDRVMITNRYLRYGVWSKRDGISRFPLPPAVDAKVIQDEASALVELIMQQGPTPPFPIGDLVEFWLLDRMTTLPLALLASGTSRARRSHIRSAEWFPALPHHRHDGLSSRSEELTHELKHKISNLVHDTAGRPASGQWFERDSQGCGLGLDGIRLDQSQINRRLSPDAFPNLALREQWERHADQKIVDEFHGWQAPVLLMLPGLPDKNREQLERLAIRRPLAVRASYNLYPKIIHRELINRALVEAEIRKAAAH